MAWILHSLFIIVMATTISKCKHSVRYSLTEDFLQYEHNYTSLVIRRLNYMSYQNNPRIGRSAEGTNKRPNERSFSAHSGTQRVQEVEEAESRNDDESYIILNYSTLSGRRGGSETSSAENRNVLPGPASGKNQKQDIPEECRRIGICKDVPNYPKELVKKVLAENADLRNMFQIDQLDIAEIPDIGQREDPTLEQELCYSKTAVVFPKGAVDRNGNFLYILNDDENPLQGVRVKECDVKKNNGTCYKGASFINGMINTCIQKKITRILWGLENNKIVEKRIKIPSCCSCVVNNTKTLF